MADARPARRGETPDRYRRRDARPAVRRPEEPRRASIRREEIITVAEDMFAERGFRNTTIRQIGDGAGILSGSLYHHFASKHDIVDDILQRHCASVLAEYRRIDALDTDPITRLKLLIHYVFRQITEERAAIMILLNDATDLVPEARFAYLASFKEEVETHWVRTIQSAIDQGQLRADLRPRLFYLFARDAMLGSITWFDASRGFPIEEIANDLIRVLLDGAAPPVRRGSD